MDRSGYVSYARTEYFVLASSVNQSKESDGLTRELIQCAPDSGMDEYFAICDFLVQVSISQKFAKGNYTDFSVIPLVMRFSWFSVRFN